MDSLVGKVLVRTTKFGKTVNSFYVVEKESRTVAMARRIGRTIVSGDPREGWEVADPNAPPPHPETLRFFKRLDENGRLDHFVGGGWDATFYDGQPLPFKAG